MVTKVKKKDAPKLKRAIVTITMNDDVNQNEFKNWLKTCPISFEGGQTVKWEEVKSE